VKSKIIELIDELEDYIESCKYQPFSNTKIIVEKDKIDEIISDFKTKTPEELKRYQKVYSNHEAILKDAREKAEALIQDAAAQTHEMISQNSIMQQAYAQADQVVKSAYVEAQNILNSATIEANELRSASVEYIDNMLAQYESIVGQTLRLTQSHYDSFYSQISQYYETVVANRAELNPPVPDPTELEYTNLDEGTLQADNTAAMNSTEQIYTQNTTPIGNTQPNINDGLAANLVPKDDTGSVKIDMI